MSDITREHLHAFLDDALTETEASRVEQALRRDDALRQRLRQAMHERDRGDHSLGSVWRRERLTCLGRDQLEQYLLEVLDEGEHGYARFHLDVIGCPYCLANLHDLQERQREAAVDARERRRKLFEGSAPHLESARGEPPR